MLVTFLDEMSAYALEIFFTVPKIMCVDCVDFSFKDHLKTRLTFGKSLDIGLTRLVMSHKL